MNTEWKPIARWYAVDAHGAATLCTCEEDARETAAESAQIFPNCAPYTAVQLVPVSAPTSHPIPTGATGDRDWELACDECNGSGHVFVKHQVAERKTDVQEFKEECEACEGRGFNIAFEDIPGIAEYLKSCRADAGATGEEQDERLFDDEAHVLVPIGLLGAACSAIDKKRDAPKTLAKLRRYTTGDLSSRHVPAPAAGDALDAARWRAFVGCARIRPLGSAGLEQPYPDHYAHMGLEIWTIYGRDYSPKLLQQMDEQNERGRRWLVMFADVALAAIAQQSQRKEA